MTHVSGRKTVAERSVARLWVLLRVSAQQRTTHPHLQPIRSFTVAKVVFGPETV